MGGIDLLWFVYDWLPRLFILDVLVFHLVADHPLAARCFSWRPLRTRSRYESGARSA